MPLTRALYRAKILAIQYLTKTMTKTVEGFVRREPVVGVNRQQDFHMTHPFRVEDLKDAETMSKVLREAA